MAGLDCNTPSISAWEIIKHGADVSMKIDDRHTIKAMRELFYPEGDDDIIKAGESGAAGLAGLLAILQDREYTSLIDELNINSNTRIMLINTEGPTDMENFTKITQ
jgi:diaminopropionate ammonia-lyase